MLSFLSLFVQTAEAQHLLIPHFTASNFSDLLLAEEMERKLIGEFSRLNVPMVTPDVLDAEFNTVGSCAENPECHSILMSRIGSKILVVGMVQSEGALVQTQIRVYGKDEQAPLHILTKQISADQIDLFLKDSAEEINVIYQLLLDSENNPPPPPEPVVPVVKKPQKPKADDVRKIKGLPQKLKDQYDASPLSPEDWIKEQRIRTHNLIVSTCFGVSFGDVTRRYDQRVGFFEIDNELVQFASYESDMFFVDTGFEASWNLGFSPTWWLETSIHGGVLLASKELSTGWELIDYDDTTVIRDSSETTQTPIESATGILEPMLRFFLIPSGPVKLYLMTGGYIRIFDEYVVPDFDSDYYRDRPGGVHFGAMGGGGLAFDSLSPVSVFVEIPWVWLLNAEHYYTYVVADGSKNASISMKPPIPTQSNQILTFRSGISLRF